MVKKIVVRILEIYLYIFLIGFTLLLGFVAYHLLDGGSLSFLIIRQQSRDPPSISQYATPAYSDYYVNGSCREIHIIEYGYLRPFNSSRIISR
jgi:hypothetical protein